MSSLNGDYPEEQPVVGAGQRVPVAAGQRVPVAAEQRVPVVAEQRVPVVAHVELLVCFAREALVDADELVVTWVPREETPFNANRYVTRHIPLNYVSRSST